MTLPASGAISFNNINVELGVSGTTQASLGQASYRALAGVASGQISMSNFYGKANQFAFTISSNTTDANLRTLALAAGWNGTSQVVATIGSGVYVYSTSTATPALTINGSFPGGVQLINNGNIYGWGGNGGNGGGYGGNYYGASTGATGGNAVTASVAVTITNSGIISGGGGGGGGGGYAQYNDGKFISALGGGGGGGGRVNAGGGGGGGGGGVQPRPGTAGTSASLTTNGTGGAGGTTAGYYGGTGGAGGNNAASGSSGNSGVANHSQSGGAGGGAGGSAVSGNSNITWVATGTRYGAIA